jgi:hypothetical protein
MNFLSDVISYVRRIIKSPTNSSIKDSLIVDFVNRFWTQDVDEDLQLFDLDTTYRFETIPGIVNYNMPLYASQTSTLQSTVGMYPVYQGFKFPCTVNGLPLNFFTEEIGFNSTFLNLLNPSTSVAVGDGTQGPFNFTIPFAQCLPGYIDMAGIISTGSNVDPIFGTTLASIPVASIYPGVFITYTRQDGSIGTITDSGQFLSGDTGSVLYGLLRNPSPFQNPPANESLGTYSLTSNTVNYVTGEVNVLFPIGSVPAPNSDINVQTYYYQSGLPRAILFKNNCLKILPPSNIPYLIEIGAYLTPAAYLNTTDAIQFAYMTEFIARGAARKILSDTGDWEQFNAYEPLFREQKMLVWKRSQRIKTANPTPTIYNTTPPMNPYTNPGIV